ncbi:Cyclic nucleotide-binding domain-containing protein [Desulfocicer vacuolatum DSM 3385]|uniref:Cyclic nucleotide-binding domain-containing protein n=1 Tax=Desulfocicer vacuolatum DSM 3385 TaxID=1121400 RepID=A0A1W1ZTW3_9BACT|nr:cyclic nucleotide-binding domain-containing protein [Desulfocicer vacuolatum]SMC51508.1 Cyclic nucleotide-binding domain-containing protein [Desulfocicer vacuolatum DSM 3385]
MKKAINILKKNELFTNVEETDLEAMGKSLETRSVQEGEVLATQGDTATFFFVLEAGTLLVALSDGKSAVLNKTGDFIGLELLSSKGIYISTVTALTPCEIVVIPRKSFLEFIQNDSPAAASFMQAWNSYRSHTFPFLPELDTPDMDYQY